ncbi:MAG: glycosyl hydrolase family 28-related protein, partial [Waterburya sp.]
MALVNFQPGTVITKEWLNDVDITLNAYTPPFINTFPRLIKTKVAESVSVKDFGAVGNGVTDDTIAIQNAVNAIPTGGSLFFPSGVYLIGSAIINTKSSITFIGESRFGTEILQNSSNLPIINNTGNFFGFSQITLRYANTPTAGGDAIRSTGSYGHFFDFAVRSAWNGLFIENGVANKIAMCDILDYENAGVLASNLNDLYITQFLMNAGNISRGQLGGIRAVNKVEGLIVTDGDILLGRLSLSTD